VPPFRPHVPIGNRALSPQRLTFEKLTFLLHRTELDPRLSRNSVRGYKRMEQKSAGEKIPHRTSSDALEVRQGDDRSGRCRRVAW